MCLLQGTLGNPLVKAALTSCSMSVLGDCLAQVLNRRPLKEGGAGAPGGIDAARLARMGGFGLLFYGPYQFYWYRALDSFFPTKSVPHFLSKVFLNQTALAPVVLAVVFSWNLVLTGQASKITGKIRHDLVPTMINGWKFWVPASSLNFCAVPLRHQA
ncbi:hypothetical protein WJX81_002847 [Elliptochloris bilobata]|uniref:Uncharacterized protein n=1 Tax=Elliptochloris bilobata TaxID=381761 RepID=A0AAW1S9Z2_9CHLO